MALLFVFFMSILTIYKKNKTLKITIMDNYKLNHELNQYDQIE